MLLDLYCDIARGLKTDRVSGVGAMIKGIIPGTDRTNSYCVIYCPDVLRTYQRATSLIKFLRNVNWEGLKIRKMDEEISLCNGFTLQGLFKMKDIYFLFHFSLPLMFRKKAIIFFRNGLYWKMSVHRQGHLSQWKHSISYKRFFIMITGQQFIV